MEPGYVEPGYVVDIPLYSIKGFDVRTPVPFIAELTEHGNPKSFNFDGVYLKNMVMSNNSSFEYSGDSCRFLRSSRAKDFSVEGENG